MGFNVNVGGYLKNKKYIEDEDRFLICKLNEIGMDTENVYDMIKLSSRISQVLSSA